MGNLENLIFLFGVLFLSIYMLIFKNFLFVVNQNHFFLIDNFEKNECILLSQVKMSDNINQDVNSFCKVSHEIRTSLNIINGLLRLSYDNISNTNKLEEYLSKIEYSSNQILSLVNNILDIGKVSFGKNILIKKDFNLEELIDNIYSIAKIKSFNKEIILNCDNFKNKYVCGDEIKVKQILLNLISNAEKYTDSNGKIELKVKQLKHNEKLKYCFIITDNGIGMSREFIKEKLFKPFEQETRNLGYGSGLGLAIVKEIVEQMNGHIKIESKLNYGTRILVTIEFDKPNKEEEINLFSLDFDLEKYKLLENKRVLVVDDNKMNLDLIKELLESKNIIVDNVSNPFEAIEMFTNNKEDYYDFILTDYFMPDINGLEFCNKIRNSNKLYSKDIIIIVSSANELEEKKNEKFNEFILKPYKIEDLLDLFFKYS